VSDRELPLLLKAYRVIRLVDLPALFLGGLGAAFGHRWGAFLLLANLFVQIGGHLALGSVAYHDAFARPWPQVAPLEDDDWDD
jgi:hypothetical protein